MKKDREEPNEIAGLVELLHRFRLTDPAVLLLELHLPISSLLSAGFVVLTPLLSLFGVGRFGESLAKTFEKRESVLELLELLKAKRA